MFFRVNVFQGTDFSGSSLFRVQAIQGPGFIGSRFFRVQVQGPGLGFRSSLKKLNLSAQEIVTANHKKISVCNKLH